MVSLPAHKRLDWLQQRDSEERAVWVAKFRESTKTLGQVVREVFNLRDARWIAIQKRRPRRI